MAEAEVTMQEEEEEVDTIIMDEALIWVKGLAILILARWN